MESWAEGYLALYGHGQRLHTCCRVPSLHLYKLLDRPAFPYGNLLVKYRTAREQREIFNSNKRSGGEMVTEE